RHHARRPCSSGRSPGTPDDWASERATTLANRNTTAATPSVSPSHTNIQTMTTSIRVVARRARRATPGRADQHHIFTRRGIPTIRGLSPESWRGLPRRRRSHCDLVARVVHALADHGRHAVAAHRHAVQRVGDLHGALLVRDDDELRVLLELAEDLQEPAEVDVVERRLDLVHDVERRRAGLEDRDEERDRGERALAA